MSDTISPIQSGDTVRYITEDYSEVDALVTQVWGSFDDKIVVPCINLVYVTPADDRRDSYGKQIERASSVQHVSQSSVRGRVWLNT